MNRNEVVILVLEDHVAPEDAVAVIKKSGLAQRAYVWPAGAPAPTMRDLIRAGKNVLIMAENHGGEIASAPWYMSAYGDILQDTRYDFDSVAGLASPSSCTLLRGTESARLFLVNQWVDTGSPDPALADDVNGSALADRVKRCALARHHQPNIIAVDFYKRGDLIGLVDHLNGKSSDIVTTAS